ncbi:MAG: SusC/RagA family TonB-linked outer membrane protein [Flavobacteriaceae bacterium]
MIKKIHYYLLVTAFLLGQGLVAQNKTVSGTVKDDAGTPLPGVNVIEKGTTNGTSTDFDGNYSLNVPGNATLVFSSLGFSTQEMPVSGSSTVNVSMVEDAEQLGEVVVTALGIKREKKSLGYAVQEIKGVALVDARENNLSNSLTGKVAGLQVVRGSNGPSSSSKIVLRGNNSLTGDNQPLVVVDGIPMDNFSGGSSDFWNPAADMGNGLGDLDPENIESMSVLKGASAAALYGSRAGNGVILITTKTGRTQSGLGITYSVTTGFEDIFISPKLQSVFGQGLNGIYDNQSGSSWGPSIEGQQVTTWDGRQDNLRAYNNLDNYFKTGVNVTHSLSFQQQISDATSLITSASYLNDESKVPGATLDRLNLMTRAVSNFGSNKNWTSDVKVQYIKLAAENRPLSGVNISNSFSTMYLLPRSLDITQFRNSTDEFGSMRWYVPANAVNPYWGAEYNQNKDTRDRFLLSGSIKNQITEWLSAEIKVGSDMYTTNTESKLYSGSPLSTTGRYSLGKRTFVESNYSALLSASKDDIIGKFGGALTFGGNIMAQERSGLSSNSGELEVPNLFSLNNGQNNPTVGQEFNQKRINSIYGTAQINYDGFFFVDVTGRNDWSSALSKQNRSFFYPSVSTSLVVSEMVDKMGGNFPDWFTYLKLRASHAQVGNDMDPYQLYNFYNIGKDPNGNTTAGSNSVLYNADVLSELIKSNEVGFEARFFNNRLGFDFSWYKSNATRQLINLPLNPLSGYNEMKANAGDIQNEGLELMVNAGLFNKPDGFSWDMTLNYSKNKNTVVSLTDEVSQYGLGGFDNLAVLAVSGELYGEIYGTKYQRVEDEASPYYNQIIVDENGIPLATSERQRLGNQQPDMLIGWTNNISYKNLSLSFLVDARIGGEIYSGTNRAINAAGTGASTVVNGERANIVVDGVVDNGSGGYTPNTTEVSPQIYWSTIGARSGNLGIGEANIYDATNIRLRSVQLNYNLPSKWLNGMAIQKCKSGCFL